MPAFALLKAAAARPREPLPVMHQAAVVPASLAETFAFFADAGNLEALTPAWLNFRIRTPMPVAMREGTIIEYTIRLYGVRIPWISRIDVWEPGVRFVDRQIAGPYRWWRHEHRFEAVSDGTLVVDHVEYLPRARILSAGLVRRDLDRIFGYRRQALQRRFGAVGA